MELLWRHLSTIDANLLALGSHFQESIDQNVSYNSGNFCDHLLTLGYGTDLTYLNLDDKLDTDQIFVSILLTVTH